MKTSPSSYQFSAPLLESLERRRLLSVSVPTAVSTLISPIEIAPTSIPATQVILTGTSIHAQTNQAFRAVIGTIRGLGPLPPGYTLQGDIDWGDGTAHSAAQFVRQLDSSVAGSLAVLGAHTYTGVGGDDITVVVSLVPPPWSDAAVQEIGTFHSKADVFAPNGGVTLNETAGAAFIARLGFFHASYPISTLRALIDWGDGTQSPGKIVQLPTAGPVPTYAVDGAHAYAATASRLVHITVWSSYPSPVASATAPAILVAQIDSVIDVLPRPARSDIFALASDPSADLFSP